MDRAVWRSRFAEAITSGGTALEAADNLCVACVDLLGVDGASISITYDGVTRGTFGSSGALSRHLDELQFTLGEGPCLDAVHLGVAVVVADLADVEDGRWPALRAALRERGVCAVVALPVRIATAYVGALDLFRTSTDQISDDVVTGGVIAAELAAIPLFDLMNAQVDWRALGEGEEWADLASLERVEVYQATGMIMDACDVGAPEALVRLRAFAYATGRTATEAAWAIIERRVSLTEDPWRDEGGA